MARRYPNLFLLGIPKCGTTSLYRYISEHPDIFAPEKKEPNYLIYDNIKELGASGKKLRNCIDNEEDYLNLYEDSAGKYLLEGTIFVYCFEDSLRRISQISPDYRAIVILRNPVDRFVSHYKMSRNLGDVRVGIEEYIKNPICGMGTNALEMGLYGYHLEKIFRIFDRDRVHVLLLDDLKTDRADAIGKIFDFLGIARMPEKDYEKNHLSSPGVARSSFLRNLYFNSQVVDGIKEVFRKTPVYKLRKIAMKSLFEQWNPPEETLYLLYRYYREDIKKTEMILDRSLDDWKVFC